MGANGRNDTNTTVDPQNNDLKNPRAARTAPPLLENLESRRLMSSATLLSIDAALQAQSSVSSLLDYSAGRAGSTSRPMRFPARVTPITPPQMPAPVAQPVVSTPPPATPAATPTATGNASAPPLASAVPIITLAQTVLPGSQPAATVVPVRSRAASDFRYVLRPGNGFTGATSQPATVGTLGTQGYDAKAIARWDVVPYQTFDTTFNVGVVAFHMSDIDRVEFSVNGGTWTAVRTMTKNPQTDVYEYTATLRAADFADGAIEVRAVAYPKVGIPRVLEALPLNTNANHSLPAAVRYVSTTGNDSNDGLTPQTPKQTTNAAAFSIQQAQGSADGGTIYLLAGTYTLNSAAWNTNSVTTNRWMTVTAAPGLDRTAVVLSGSSGSTFNSKLVRFSNVTVTGALNSGGPLVDYIWIDNCYIHGTSWLAGGGGADSSFTYRYLTDTNYADAQVGPQGYDLIRNVRVDRIGGDAFSGSSVVINSSIHASDQAPGAHTDVWQWVGAAANIIMYGVDNTDQIGSINSTVLFESSCQDVAVVNCSLSVGGGYYAVQLGHTLNNMYSKNTKFFGGTRLYDTLIATNVVYDACTFGSAIPVTPGIIVR